MRTLFGSPTAGGILQQLASESRGASLIHAGGNSRTMTDGFNWIRAGSLSSLFVCVDCLNSKITRRQRFGDPHPSSDFGSCMVLVRRHRLSVDRFHEV